MFFLILSSVDEYSSSLKEIKSANIFILLLRKQNMCNHRHLKNLRILKWYEDIFGKEMWNHVITEATYHQHFHHKNVNTQERMNAPFLWVPIHFFTAKFCASQVQTDEMCQTRWSKRIQNSSKINVDTNIPGMFIDAYKLNVFGDPCNGNWKISSISEKDKFNKSMQR